MAALLLVGSAVLGLASGLVVDLVARRVPRLRSRDRRVRPAWVMAATSALFVLVAARFGASPALPAFWFFAASLVALSIIDLEHRVVPNALVYPSALGAGLLLGVAALGTGSGRAAIDAMVGAAVGFGVLLGIHLVKPAGMGFGDVRLGGLIGLNVGFLGLKEVVVALFLAFLLVALVGGALVALGRAGRHAQIPFVPFLAAAALLAVGWGSGLVTLLLG